MTFTAETRVQKVPESPGGHNTNSNFAIECSAPPAKPNTSKALTTCADCHVALVHELPRTDPGPPPDITAAPLPETGLVAVFETEDVYAFLEAADTLRRAGIPFQGVEHYTGEFRATKRAQAPYVRALLVSPEREEQALKVLATLVGQV